MIDLPRAQEAFEASQDGTVGIEEEFALLDPATLQLTPGFAPLFEAAQRDPVLAPSVAGELIASEIEIRSGRGEDVEAALQAQRASRRALFTLAEAQGLKLGSTGTHPLSFYQDQHLIDTAHYRRVGDGLQYVAWRNNTFSVHVHVGVRGADRAIQVTDRLRPVLPTLLAISANSPYVDKIDSGLHTARTQTFTKSFPRCGVPDPFGDWGTWADYVDLLVRTGSVVEFTQLWWSVRPHHDYGTVEVRICDAQTTAGESDALVRLVVACVLQAAREVDEGRAGEPAFRVPGRLIEENLWRAIRFGMDGRLLDLEGPEVVEYPASEAVARLGAWAGVETDGLFPAANGAQRQRRMIAEGASPAEVYATCVAETAESYKEVVQR